MKRITGIGGIPEKLYQWYERHLGIKREPHPEGNRIELWEPPKRSRR